jgi:galactokinase/mevalonate kinase-like predicted kinase
MNTSGNVSLTISQDIVTPIVEAKVKEAVLAALGGQDKVVETVINTVLKQKVNFEGRLSQYSSDNKYSWMDVTISNTIKDMVREQVKELLQESGETIKKYLKKQLKSEAGSNLLAQAMIDGFAKSFESAWSSKVTVDFVKDFKD